MLLLDCGPMLQCLCMLSLRLELLLLHNRSLLLLSLRLKLLLSLRLKLLFLNRSLLQLSLGIQELIPRLLLWSRGLLLLDRRSNLLLSMSMIEKLRMVVLWEPCRRLLLWAVLFGVVVVGGVWTVIAIHAVTNSRLLKIWRRNTRR